MKTEHLKIMLIYQTIIPSSDCRKVLKICRCVGKIKAGLMPENTEEKLYPKCTFSEHCV